ncbi:3-dehydroquinate dehydratase-2 [Constrictibacter sp. MBR-5]|jgi:3-dehydroquinate dehydratase-2|uniref:type II 3-dehydroquinate dehydratase n=1 Tax=Constrictibacter sp. MBR-5 TaxID=3156467 RepID=UPI00339A29A6
MPLPVLVLNGPNLNMLGVRQPEVYGRQTLADIEADCRARAGALGLEIDFRQTNSEAELLGWVHASRGQASAVVINPAAFTHTSIALLDALLLLDVPVIEVHLSNVHRREAFRRHSYVSQAAQGVICGFGGQSYILAIDAVASILGIAPEN